MKPIKSIFILLTLFLITAPAWAEDAAHQQIRKEAQNAYKNGHWKDAFELYRRLSLETENDPRMVGKDFTQAWQCLRQLNRLHELDTFREEVI